MAESTKYTAPKLFFKGVKDQDNMNTNQSYIIPQRLGDIINNLIDSRAGGQIKIMYVLCGTKQGFTVHEDWICKRTGLSSASYSRALKELKERGWIEHKPYQSITVNYDKIYADGRRELPLEENYEEP